MMEHVESCGLSCKQYIFILSTIKICHVYQACTTTGELRAMAEERECAAVGRRTSLG